MVKDEVGLTLTLTLTLTLNLTLTLSPQVGEHAVLVGNGLTSAGVQGGKAGGRGQGGHEGSRGATRHVATCGGGGGRGAGPATSNILMTGAAARRAELLQVLSIY
jgi:hypothetical protein